MFADLAESPKTSHMVGIVQEGGEGGAWRREMGPAQVGLLQDALSRFVTQDAFRYYHPWERGDLVIWDHLATLHCVMPWKYGTKQSTLNGSAVPSQGAEKQLRVMWRANLGTDDNMSLGNGQVDRARMPPFH